MENILTCYQHGSSQYYFLLANESSKNEIEIIDVDVIYNSDAYVFSVKLPLNKKIKGGSTDYFDFSIMLINSPNIICGTTKLDISFNVTFLDDNVMKNEIISQTKTNTTIYYSSGIKDRSYSPNALRLDSIYRPFFVNSVLLLLPDNFLTSKTTHKESKKCCARLYYSIANGCTYRVDKEMSQYMIGDIDIKLLHNTSYTLKIKGSHRNFSEISDPHSDKKIRSKHIAGIRECGYNNTSLLPTLDGAAWFSVKSGINLSSDINNKTLYPSYTYDKNELVEITDYSDENGNKFNIGYFDGDKSEKEQNVYHIDSTEPLVFDLTISDYAPIGYNSNTISISTNPIRFPDNIDYNDGKISFKSEYNNSNISYLYMEDDETLEEIITQIGSINVNDDIVNQSLFNDSITAQSIYKMLSSKTSLFVNFEDDENGNYVSNISKNAKYLIGIHHEATPKSDEDDSYSFIKHTNKLLVIKVYKLS